MCVVGRVSRGERGRAGRRKTTLAEDALGDHVDHVLRRDVADLDHGREVVERDRAVGHELDLHLSRLEPPVLRKAVAREHLDQVVQDRAVDQRGEQVAALDLEPALLKRVVDPVRERHLLHVDPLVRVALPSSSKQDKVGGERERVSKVGDKAGAEAGREREGKGGGRRERVVCGGAGRR